MEDKSNISIFQGSAVEADTVHDYLAQQGIGSLIRNHMQETLDAGWVTATPDYAAEVFVAVEDEARVHDLLKNLFQGDDSSERVVPVQTEQDKYVEQQQMNRPPVSGSSQMPNTAAESRPLPPPTAPPSL